MNCTAEPISSYYQTTTTAEIGAGSSEFALVNFRLECRGLKQVPNTPRGIFAPDQSWRQQANAEPLKSIGSHKRPSSSRSKTSSFCGGKQVVSGCPSRALAQGNSSDTNRSNSIRFNSMRERLFRLLSKVPIQVETIKREDSCDPTKHTSLSSPSSSSSFEHLREPLIIKYYQERSLLEVLELHFACSLLGKQHSLTSGSSSSQHLQQPIQSDSLLPLSSRQQDVQQFCPQMQLSNQPTGLIDQYTQQQQQPLDWCQQQQLNSSDMSPAEWPLANETRWTIEASELAAASEFNGQEKRQLFHLVNNDCDQLTKQQANKPRRESHSKRHGPTCAIRPRPKLAEASQFASIEARANTYPDSGLSIGIQHQQLSRVDREHLQHASFEQQQQQLQTAGTSYHLAHGQSFAHYHQPEGGSQLDPIDHASYWTPLVPPQQQQQHIYYQSSLDAASYSLGNGGTQPTVGSSSNLMIDQSLPAPIGYRDQPVTSVAAVATVAPAAQTSVECSSAPQVVVVSDVNNHHNYIQSQHLQQHQHQHQHQHSRTLQHFSRPDYASMNFVMDNQLSQASASVLSTEHDQCRPLVSQLYQPVAHERAPT